MPVIFRQGNVSNSHVVKHGLPVSMVVYLESLVLTKDTAIRSLTYLEEPGVYATIADRTGRSVKVISITEHTVMTNVVETKLHEDNERISNKVMLLVSYIAILCIGN